VGSPSDWECHAHQEGHKMSALNGDKARYQKLRKAGIRRRLRSKQTAALAKARLAAAQAPAPDPAGEPRSGAS
jgi:hypothetical protein